MADSCFSEHSSRSVFSFKKELYTNIRGCGLREVDCQELFEVLCVWPNLEWTQHLKYVKYVAEYPEFAIQRITRIYMILHTLCDHGYLQKCRICGGTGCNWCDPERCTLPLTVKGSPMNKQFIERCFEASQTNVMPGNLGITSAMRSA